MSTNGINVTHSELKEWALKGLLALASAMLCIITAISGWMLTQIVAHDKNISVLQVRLDESEKRQEITNAKLAVIETKLDAITSKLSNVQKPQ